MELSGQDGTHRSGTSVLAIAAGMVLATSPAYAQNTPANGAPDIEHSGDIIVTAQRREQDLQDVALALTSIGGDDLAGAAIFDSTDIDNQVPNLVVDPIAGSGSQPAVFLRGIGLNDFSLNNSGPVGLYLDDVYLSSFSSQNFLLFDMDRIEVLRGPQGTLYGRNTTGGAINYISRGPTDELSGYIQGTYGRFDRYEVEGAISGPLAPGISARVALARQSADGFFTNDLTGTRSNGTDLWAVRATLKLEPSPTARILLRFRADINQTPFSQYERFEVIDPDTGGLCTDAQARSAQCIDALGYTDTTPRFHGNFDREEDIDRKAYGTSAKAEFDIGNMTLTSITAYEWGTNYLPEESDASPLQLLAITLGADTDTFTQELRLTGESDRANWILGAYYLDETIKQDQTADLFRELRPIIDDLSPVDNPGGFDPDGAVLGAPVFFSRHLNRQKTKSYALFGQVEYELTEELAVVAGLRYTKEDRSFNTVLQFEEPEFTIPVYDLDLDFEDDDISGKVGLNYQPNPNLLLYVSASKGFKSGGFNGGFLFDPAENTPFDSETLYAYEAGAKITLPDRLGRVNLSTFYYDYSDLQVFTLINTGGVPATILDNAANAEVYGAEAEVFLRPVTGLSVSLAAGYLHSKLKDFQTVGQDYSGNRLPRSPKLTFNATVGYDIAVTDDLDLTPSFSFRYTDDYFFLTDNQPLASQSAYWLANAQLRLASNSSGWEISGFVDNLFDKEYDVQINDLADFGFYQVVVGAPRSYGVRASVSF